MAGYLGKISAVVAVNNSDVKPKLEASAADVTKFARGVERDLRSASSSAAKSFEGIYTPLQKMERALQAASSMKLSFKGFDGALKDVEGLRSRLASLARQRVQVDVSGTGFNKVSELRAAISSITSKDIKFIADLGGLERARSLLGAMSESESEVLAKFAKLKSLDQIKVAIDVVGIQGLDAATLAMRQMAEASIRITAPLKEASNAAAGFSLAIQQGLAPAMASAQAAAEGVRAAIGRPGAETMFSSAERQARQLLAVIKQVGEAQAAAGGLKTGRELAFANPRLAAQLASAKALGTQAAEMPASFLTASPAVAGLVQQLNAVSQKSVEAFAALRGATSGIDQSKAAAELNRLQEVLDGLLARLSKQLPLDIDTSKAVSKVDELEQKLTRAKSAFLPPVLQSESQSLSLSGEATYADYEAKQRRAADARMRAEYASAMFLPILPKVPEASDMFGPMLGSSAQKTSALVSQIRSLQDSISQLPVPLQAKLIPALEKARQAAFAIGKNPTAAELAKAAQQAENLERQLKRVQTASQFRGTFRSFIDDNAANNYATQLNAIRQGLLAVGATAGGPVASAVNKYQRALYDAANAGRLGTDATKKQMDELLQKIAQVAVAQGNMSKKQATAFVQMVQRSSQGDIGRMGLGNTSLALQQLGFAVDDFFSSTGGIEFKLRAISNNLTQMAFILGGTKGLWIGLGAVIAAQVGIPIAKAIFAFDDMESRTKSLNSELEKSKNIAERTAEAYKELGKALRESGLGSAAGKVQSFASDRRAEARAQAESAVFSTNREYVALASRLQSLRDNLEKTGDIGDRARIGREIDQIVRRLEGIRREGISPSPLADISDAISSARSNEIAGLRESADTFFDFAIGGNSSQRLSGAMLREFLDRSPKTPKEALAKIDDQLSNSRAALSNMPVADWLAQNYPKFLMLWEDSSIKVARELRESISRLEEERSKLAQDVNLSENERLLPRAMAAAAAAELNPGALDKVAKAGVASAVQTRFERDIAGVSEEFGKIITDLEKAVRAGEDTRELEKAADDAARALELLYKEADRLAASATLGAFVPTSERLSRAAEQIKDFGPSNTATDIARVQALREQFESERNRAKTRGDELGVNAADYQLKRLDGLTTKLEAAAIAVAAFQKAVEEAALSLSAALVEEAQQRAQELRRTANRFDDPAFRDAAAAAAEEARRQEARDRQLQRDLNRERIQFESDMAGGRDPEAKAIADRARAAEARAANKELSAAEQQAARIEAEDARLELQRRFENRPGTMRARAAANAADAAAARERDRIDRANEMRQRVFGGLDASFRGSVGVAGGIDAASLSRALALDEEMQQLQRDMEAALQAGIDKPFEDLMEDMRRRIEEINADLVDEQVKMSQARSKTTEGQLEAARRNLERAGISDLEGRATEIEVRRRDLERRRDEAIAEKTPEGNVRAAQIQEEIDAQKELTAELLAATVAVSGFQEALERAALSLQNSLVGEATSRADDARRQANEAAAVFGEDSPEAKRARGRADRAERAMRDAQDERDAAEAAINAERIRFEQEIANGQNPAAKARADEIARLEKDAADESLTKEKRAAARAEANRLRREQEREFEARPGVQAQRERADRADRDMARRQSVERGLEMGLTENDRRRENIRRQAGDLGNAADSLRDEGRFGEVGSLVRNASLNMAKEVAPLFEQLTNEVMTARIQGPSRAALKVSDIQTSEGASELNRLIRGDDSARDVNLAELQKQSRLLEAIEKAILDTTGVVVNF